MIIQNKPKTRYPRQGPSCLLLIIFLVGSAIGLFIIANADDVRETLQPTEVPPPTRDAVALAVSADLYARDGDFPAAIANYEQAIYLDGTNPAFYLPLIDLLIVEDETDRALEWAERANTLAPEDPVIWTALASAYLAQGDRLSEVGEGTEAATAYANAVRAAREAVRLEPQNGLAHAYWAGALVSQFGPDGIIDAVEQIELALALEPDNPDVRIMRALVLENQGLYEEAIEEYQIAIELTRSSSELAELYIAQAYNSFALRNIPDAILYFQDALAQDPESADAYDGLAYMFFLVGEYPRAAENAEQAVELDPQMVRAYAHLGAAQFRQNFYEQAIENLSFAVDAYNDVTVANAIYFNMLGLAYVFEEQDCVKARPLFEEVLAAIPDEPNALEGLDLCRGN